MDLVQLYQFGIPIISVCACIDIVFCIILLRQLYFKEAVLINGYFKQLTVITTILYTICSIGDIIRHCLRYFNYLRLPDFNKTDHEAVLTGSSDFLYYVGNVTFFLLLLMRIKTSFQVSKLVMYYLFCLLFTSGILSLTWCFIIIYYGETENTAAIIKHLKITEYPSPTVDFLLNFSLMILFIQKIRNKDTMEGIESIDMNTPRSNESAQSHNRQNKAILNVMIKHCVLFGITLLANLAFYISVIITELPAVKAPSATVLMITSLSRSVGNTIIVVILWLVLKINSTKYVYLCKCWHICLLKYCMKEDADVIREGFVENEEICQRVVPLLVSSVNNGRSEGNNLLVTDRVKAKIEGDVLLTAE